ncbi:hypothetical protein O9993_12485 [Vibrio lentus]|nr:hypothetical protein [Vibrio lentus]
MIEAKFGTLAFTCYSRCLWPPSIIGRYRERQYYAGNSSLSPLSRTPIPHSTPVGCSHIPARSPM